MTTNTENRHQGIYATGSKPLHLFIFADALGWQISQERSFLKDLLPHQQKCDTIFGYSSTCDPTILTGVLPQEHGHFSFFVYDPQHSPFAWSRPLGWLPTAITGRNKARNVLSRWAAKKMGYTGYFQLYSVPFSKLHYLDYTEKRDIYQPKGILGGQETIFDLWKRSGKRWMRSDWRKSDAENVAHLKQAIEKEAVELAYLFTAGLDATMHAHKVHSPTTDKAFAQFEKWVREIHQLATRNYKDVYIYLFSDHGMVDTVGTSSMMLEMDQLGLSYGRDYGAVWDSTMVRFWFPEKGKSRQEIIAWLKGKKEGRILNSIELKKWGCWFEESRYGELFFLLNNGMIFVPSFMNLKFVPAMHGFDPDEKTSAACWLTNNPTAHHPARIDQIFNVMKEAAQK